MKPYECRGQAWAGSEANIHKASFIERRLFFSFLQIASQSAKFPDFAVQLCYKGMR
jgi:hypothetical protein